MRKVIIAWLAVAVTIGAVLVSRQTAGAAPPPPSEAALLFVGFTNIPAKGPCATFCLTNCTSAHFVCVPDSIEKSAADGWIRTPLTGRARRQMRDWSGLKEEL